MSAKPKVYQGVKVRMTVKELLEKRRALQSERNVAESLQGKMQISDPIPSSEMYSAYEATPSVQSYHETRQCPAYVAQEDTGSFLDQLLLDAYLQPGTVTDSSLNVFQNPNVSFPGGEIQPSPIFHHNMTPESPSDASDLSNSFEYSPTYQSLEFAPESYSSPSHQDFRSCAYAGMDHYAYQHQHQQNATFCYCAYCSLIDFQEPMKLQDSCAYSNMDFSGCLTPLEDVFMRDMANNDLCYR